MNIFILILAILCFVSSIFIFILNITFLSKKTLKIGILSMIMMFCITLIIIASFLIGAQEIENYRGNPQNNQSIIGEDDLK